MCCIFTCCGWVIDLLQRLWTFTMSCCISSAVCCSLLTASMAGVALGYNYSLAEYIDLKETNVSVYLKRGIFDDEISDDMEWRRSGHKPIDGFINEDKLITGESDESTSMRSGRRLDDSIYESNDKHSFEGSLMRLTAKPPADIVTPMVATRTSEINMHEIVQPFESGSLDQLKAIQSAINMRKAAAANRQTTIKSEVVVSDGRRRLVNPLQESGHEIKYNIPPYDNFHPNSQPPYVNPLRLAVPDDQINKSYQWRMPKMPPQEFDPPPYRVPEQYRPDFYSVAEGYRRASPVTPRLGPAKPTQPMPIIRLKPPTTQGSTSSISPEELPRSIDEEMESFQKKPLLDTFDAPGVQDDEFLKKTKMSDKNTDEDYEDEIKGIPLRKKRNIELNALNKLKANKSIKFSNLKGFHTETELKDIGISYNTLTQKNNLESVMDGSMNKKGVHISKVSSDSGLSSPIMKLLLVPSIT